MNREEYFPPAHFLSDFRFFIESKPTMPLFLENGHVDIWWVCMYPNSRLSKLMEGKTFHPAEVDVIIRL